MAANYLPYEPRQMILLPEAIQDWLPEGHLAHFISDTVDTLELRAFHARHDQDGPRNQPFHSAMMVKVLLYGFATDVFSSRKIARKLHEYAACALTPQQPDLLTRSLGIPYGALASCMAGEGAIF